MTLVVEGHRPGPAFLQGESGLGSVQRLNLALLIEGEDNRSLGRGNVEADHVAELLNELGVLGQLEVLDSVRLEAVGQPDATDLTVMQTDFLGHEALAPMGALGRALMQGLADHLGLDVLRDRSRPTRARPLELDSRDPFRLITVEPALHRKTCGPRLPTDDVGGPSFGRSEHDARSFDQSLGRRTRANPLLKRLPVPPAQPDLANGSGHAEKIHPRPTNSYSTFAPLH